MAGRGLEYLFCSLATSVIENFLFQEILSLFFIYLLFFFKADDYSGKVKFLLGFFAACRAAQPAPTPGSARALGEGICPSKPLLDPPALRSPTFSPCSPPGTSHSHPLIGTAWAPRAPACALHTAHPTPAPESHLQLQAQFLALQPSLYGPYVHSLFTCPHPAIPPSPQANASIHPSLLLMHRHGRRLPNSAAITPSCTCPASPPGPQPHTPVPSPPGQPCPHAPFAQTHLLGCIFGVLPHTYTHKHCVAPPPTRYNPSPPPSSNPKGCIHSSGVHPPRSPPYKPPRIKHAGAQVWMPLKYMRCANAPTMDGDTPSRAKATSKPSTKGFPQPSTTMKPLALAFWGLSKPGISPHTPILFLSPFLSFLSLGFISPRLPLLPPFPSLSPQPPRHVPSLPHKFKAISPANG